MRSFYKTNRQPGRNQFQYLKKIWSFRHKSPSITMRGKIRFFVNVLAVVFSGYIGYLIYSLLTPEHGLFRVSLFHILDK